MRIVAPFGFVPTAAIPDRFLVVTKAEGACLLRAAAILERGHELVAAFNEDHQDREDIGAALCLAPSALRELVADGLLL